MWIAVVVAVLAAGSLALDAQAPAGARPEAARIKSTPESTDFAEARNQKDPERKVTALQTFLAKYPSSERARMARREIAGTLLKLPPDRASQWVKSYGRHAQPLDRADLFQQYARLLLNEKKDLKVAEKCAARALKDTRWPSYWAAAQRVAAARKEEAPDKDEALSDYGEEVASRQSLVGQIYAAQGNPKKARPLLRKAWQGNPTTSADAASALSDIALKQGDAAEALDWAARAALIRPNKDRKARLTELYAKQKGDGDTAREAYLDALYRKMFPASGEKTKPYAAPPGRTRRIVLAEVYTGAGCPPCVGADVAFDGVLERYPRPDVAVVMYHVHVPRPDPLTNSDTLARWKWQEGRGVPTYGVDGEIIKRGGGGRSYAHVIEDAVAATIDKELQTEPGAALELRVVNDGQHVKVSIRAGQAASKDAALRLVLVEKVVRYSGENGIRFHPMVARSIANLEFTGGAIERDFEFTREAVNAALRKHMDDFEKHDDRHNKDGKFRWSERRDSVDWSNVAVVGFIQDTKTKKVLQALWADAPPPGQGGVPTGE
jgi:hypothetical protein